MSAEDEAAARKAKADRAKKLLAQRQKAKAKATASAAATPGSPTSTINDVGASARTSLSLDDSARGEVGGPNGSASGVAASSAALQEAIASKVEDTKAAVTAAPKVTAPLPQTPSTSAEPPTEDRRPSNAQTVSLLLSERTDLQTEISTLKGQLEGAKAETKLLDEGRTLISKLEEENRQLVERAEAAEDRAKRVDTLEEELDSSKRIIVELEEERDRLRKSQEEEEGKRKEGTTKLEAQIADLEKTLERARGREGGLEAEVGRLKQSNSELSGQVSTFTTELESLRTSSTSTDKRLSDLQATHSTLVTSHDVLKSSHDTLSAEKSELESRHAKLEQEHKASTGSSSSLQTKLDKAESELETLRTSLVNDKKRAEGAEKKREALQVENGELVKQLEEVRGKVVTIMEEKVELAATVESWETKSKAWDKSKGDLDARTEEVRALRDQISALSESNRHLSTMSATHDLLKREHSDLQTELENLQNDLTSRDEAINALRMEMDTRPNGSAGPSTPSKSAHRRQDSEKIRALETSLHASSSRVYDLERQLAELQISYTEASRARDQAVASATRSPPHQGGLFLAPPDGTPSGRRSPGIGVDAILPAAMRHKRQVSLTALKARMTPHRTVSSRMDAVDEDDPTSPGLGSENGALGILDFQKAPQQFGDEIVGCCPACMGELITL